MLEKIGKVNCAQPQHDLCSPPTKTSHILQLSCPRGGKINKRNDERKKRFRLFDFALAITTAPEGNRRRPPKPAESPPGVSDCSRLLKTAATSTTVSNCLHNCLRGGFLFHSSRVVSRCHTLMARRAVGLLLGLTAVLAARSCCALSCPAICRCGARTFQCSRDTQLASGAAPVKRL